MSRTESRLVELGEMHQTAMQSYLMQDEIATLGIMAELLARTKEANEIATRELDSALLWVHMINWLVVTATFMFSGHIVWTLMVKRRLYREVRSTQLRGRRMEGW